MRPTRLLLAITGLFLCSTSVHAATVTQTFGVQTSFSSGPGSLAFTLAGLNPAVESDLTIDFTFFGDLNGFTENFELFADGTSYGVGCDVNPTNGNFGNFGLDICSQNNNSLTTTSVLISSVAAAGLLADGVLNLLFAYNGNVNAFVDINNGGQTRSGVFFGNVQNASFGVGGTVSYEATEPPAPVPLPPALPMALAGIAALWSLRRLRPRSLQQREARAARNAALIHSAA